MYGFMEYDDWCIQNGEEEKGIDIFLEMRRVGSPCSEFTISSVVCACAAKGGVFLCRQLHAFAVKAAVDAVVFVGTALLYEKRGFIEEASCVLKGCLRGVMLRGAQGRQVMCIMSFMRGLGLFARGQEMGLECNQFMIPSVISARAGLEALIEGRQAHAIVCRTGFGSIFFFAASTLVDMYAKCGSIKEAYAVL